MKLSSLSVSMAAVALLAGGVALWPANAQQPSGDKPATPSPASPDHPAGRQGPRGEGGDDWRSKLGVDLSEHPSLGRALVSLHQTKTYLEKTDNDLGGHKASALKAVDDAIKELSEAIKFDPKQEPRPNDRPGRRPRGAGGPGGPPEGRPAGDAPAGK